MIRKAFWVGGGQETGGADDRQRARGEQEAG